jgi:hypothetical protein
MIESADLAEGQDFISVKDFCSYLESKGYSVDRYLRVPAAAIFFAALLTQFFSFLFYVSVRLVLQNFFECMYNQQSDDDATSAGHKSQALPAAVNAADTIAMEKFAHVAEKFVQKSVKAALAPYKDAIMRFSQIQMDTVRFLARRLRKNLFFVSLFKFSCVLVCFQVRLGSSFDGASDGAPLSALQPPSLVRSHSHKGQ